MSPDALHVTTAHLRELSAKHGQAAAEIMLATAAVSDVDRAIRTSHGVIAWSTAAAVEAVQQARRDAGDSLARGSAALRDKLTAAADRYEDTDHTSGGDVERQLRPGPATVPGRPPR